VSSIPRQSSVKSLGRSVRNAGQAIAQGTRYRISVQPEVGVPVVHMLPIVTTLAVLLYSRGEDKNIKARGGTNNQTWQRVLLESALGHWLADNIGGAYRLLFVLLGAFRAGKEDSTLGKIHALVNTATTLFLGWMGVNLFAGMAAASLAFEEHNILSRLNHDDLTRWIDTDLRAKHPELTETLNDLRQHLTEKMANKDTKNRPDAKRESVLSSVKTTVVAQWDTLGEHLPQPHDASRQEWEQLQGWLRFSDSSFTRFRRYINPMCGYILTGLLLGAPLARWLNERLDKQVDKRAPGLKTRDFNQAILPTPNAMLQPGILTTPYHWLGY
jgi:hypothetical protein